MDDFLIHSLILVVVFSCVPLTAASLAAMGVVFLQALTQVQEQTLVFLIKLVAVCGTLYLAAGLVVDSFLELLGSAASGIASMGGT